jgi:uncharacterized protein YraI
MKQFGFARRPASILTSGLLAIISAFFTLTVVRAQQVVLCAATLGQGAVYVTVNSDQPQVNVRGGPNSYLYGKTGILYIGESAPALGRSAGGDWIQIACPGAPGNVGWVYAANVTLSAQVELVVIDIPATSTPVITATIDPTLAAAFPLLEPTTTRLPTFTPAAPLTIPVFTDVTGPNPSMDVQGSFIIIIFVMGLAVLLLSFFIKR